MLCTYFAWYVCVYVCVCVYEHVYYKNDILHVLLFRPSNFFMPRSQFTNT